MFNSHAAEIIGDAQHDHDNKAKSLQNQDNKSCYQKYEEEMFDQNDKESFASNMYKVMVNKKENLVLTASQIGRDAQEGLRSSFRSAGRKVRNPSIKNAVFQNKNKNSDLKDALITVDQDPLSEKGTHRDPMDIVQEESIEEEYKPKFVLAPYLLALAMGIHAAFAGLALGVVNDYGGFIGMLAAILTHKWAEAMTIGISFAKHLKDVGMKQTIILLFFFSFFTPLGIAIGIAIQSSDPGTNAIFMGLSAGTFIYIAASEIIVEEFNVSKHKFWKFLFYCIGVALMGSVFFIEEAIGGGE